MKRLAWLFIVAQLAACGGGETSPGKPPPASVPSGPNQPPASETQMPPPEKHVLSPQETVTKFVTAYLNKRLGEYYDLVATVDKKAKSLEKLQEEFAPSSSDLVTDYVFQRTTFRVDSTSIDGDSALVYVTSTAPDINAVVHEARAVERNLGDRSNPSTKLDILTERLRLEGDRRIKNPTVYFLVREPVGWRVVMGWAEQKAFKERMHADSTHDGGK